MADGESLVEKSENEGRDSVGSDADVEEEQTAEIKLVLIINNEIT